MHAAATNLNSVISVSPLRPLCVIPITHYNVTDCQHEHYPEADGNCAADHYQDVMQFCFHFFSMYFTIISQAPLYEFAEPTASPLTYAIHLLSDQRRSIV
jgi:hypothetical protein